MSSHQHPPTTRSARGHNRRGGRRPARQRSVGLPILAEHHRTTWGHKLSEFPGAESECNWQIQLMPYTEGAGPEPEWKPPRARVVPRIGIRSEDGDPPDGPPPFNGAFELNAPDDPSTLDDPDIMREIWFEIEDSGCSTTTGPDGVTTYVRQAYAADDAIDDIEIQYTLTFSTEIDPVRGVPVLKDPFELEYKYIKSDDIPCAGGKCSTWDGPITGIPNDPEIGYNSPEGLSEATWAEMCTIWWSVKQHWKELVAGVY
ncbi:hypothetical protein MIND_01411500 [Mycena indigotica]|uniref:Uncharacterized protein n=1 Tax=Mycena indigotica TaxID=2126181 RepID=A0A8H6RXW5_9AGAR|nr:uncharacterized protein MIND_01411500 [Mycena indigotica]KAF7288951.1 hypothetical protein MIND_01411500 [Mycena indigotica]